MPAPALEFVRVAKSYGRRTVVNGVDLTIVAGESLGLVGVNGAGKSTLIKCLLDFTRLDDGEIRLYGLPNTDPASRRPLAYLPEKFIPPYYLTAEDFLRYMVRLYNNAYNRRAVEEVLENVDFDPGELGKPVRQLSKGMSQKLGLAACLLSGRDLLVLDEPMSGLDPRARACVKRHLQALQRNGQTLFFSTHLLADVEILCDRVAILHEGLLRFVGTPAECCDHYGSNDLEEAYLNCVEDQISDLRSVSNAAHGEF